MLENYLQHLSKYGISRYKTVKIVYNIPIGETLYTLITELNDISGDHDEIEIDSVSENTITLARSVLKSDEEVMWELVTKMNETIASLNLRINNYPK